MSDRSSSHTAYAIYSAYIINKAGGLIYQKDFAPSAGSKLTTNDSLRLASTFHSLHAITAKGIQITPNNKPPTSTPITHDALPRNQEGIQSLEARDFRLHSYQTLTGLKFVLIAAPNFTPATLEKILQSIYLGYCDYVLKNPFYELEMPIRLEQFDQHIQRLIQSAMGHSIHGSDRREK